MPEDEYAEYTAYLKKRSYDDLLSISYYINKETQARRYEMVLAELAERDKRGEKSGDKGSDKSDDPMDTETAVGFFVTIVGVFFVILGLFEVFTGTAHSAYRHEIIAAEKPVEFSIYVGLHFAMGAMFVFKGFNKIKK